MWKMFTVHFVPFYACSCVSLLSIALLLPVLPIVVILTNKDYEFGFLKFPTAFCHTKNEDVFHYSVAFIINIILFIGIPMLSYLLWTLHKVIGMQKCMEIGILFSTWKIFTINIKFLPTCFGYMYICLWNVWSYYTPNWI